MSTNGNGNGNERMILTIRKLLAKAQGTNNEHEATAFAEKAQALLAEYNLSMADVADKGTDEGGEEIVKEEAEHTSSYPWRRTLANAVAHMYFCKYFYQTRRGKFKDGKWVNAPHDVHTFVGAKHNIAVAKLMFAYLDETVDRLAREGARGRPKAEQSPYRTTFRVACALRVQKRIYDRIAAAKRGDIKSEGTGKNLPALLSLYETWDKRNKDFIDREVGGLRSRKTRMSMTHGEAAAHGRAAGDSIGLDPQVRSGAQAKHLLR